MITIIYTVPVSQKAAELEWLREQKVFPSCQDWWDWDKDEQVIKIGMIVSPDTALAIKLRHKLDVQQDYRQR